MPGRLKVRIIAGRHLPVMDRASESTDAFVEVKFGSLVCKTDVCSKSLNPQWNSEWFKFEVNDELLQDEPLQVRVFDHDTYSAHDAIGKVYIDVDPLLDPDSHLLRGWFPIYDTMHGIRGEILLVVRLELFADVNQFKQTSCGFKFICGTSLPSCYQIQAVCGFVSDLMICEDPEYKWIEKLRTPRASNEARQRVFMKMSGELQRRIGRKVEAVGGNAVVGYRQAYDIEGESGIVIRGIGTAVVLKAEEKHRSHPLLTEQLKRSQSVPYPPSDSSPTHHVFPAPKESIPTRSSDFPFYTLTSFPAGAIGRISTMVCSRSIKLLEKVHNQEDWETRELWWSELRQEISSHCSSLSCNAVIGYREEVSIYDDVAVLSAEGTAADVDIDAFKQQHRRRDELYSSYTKDDNELTSMDNRLWYDAFNALWSTSQLASEEAVLFRAFTESGDYAPPVDCQPSPLDGVTPVPELLFCTIDIPTNARYAGKGTLVQTRFCRKLKKSQSESFALQVSDLLPFIEYELHRQLYAKVKIRGMNAVFGYRSTVTVCENLVVAVGTGTATRLAALPHSGKLQTNEWNKTISDFFDKSLKKFDLDETVTQGHLMTTSSNVSCDTKDTFTDHANEKRSIYIELPDVTSNDVITDALPPPSCFHSNLDKCPGVDGFHEQCFFSLRRIRYDDDAEDEELNEGLSRSFHQMINSLWFRMRRRNPICFLSSLRFRISLPDDDEVQIWITGSILFNNENTSSVGDSTLKRRSAPYPLRELSIDRSSNDIEFEPGLVVFDEKPSSSSFLRTRLSPFFNRLLRNPVSTRSRYNSTSSSHLRQQSESSSASEIDFTDASRAPNPVTIATSGCVPGRRALRHLGVLNLFIVRETLAVRGSEEAIPMAEPEHGTGSSWFAMRTLAETQALIRSHVMALGGNALTSYQTSYVVLKESLTKNEAQCLLHVIGDVMEYA